MKRCKFTFDDTPSFDGFAHGSTWNGFDNVCVTPETLADIVQYFRTHGDPETADDIAELIKDPMENGLISLGWCYATTIVKTMGVSNITFADIEKAASIDDVDVALKGLQDIAGITDGGIAGIVFSDIEWTKESNEERHKILIHYLRVERRYEKED